MTFAQLLDGLSWPNLQAALLRCYPDHRNSLERYQILFGKLKSTDPQESTMRIVVKESYNPKIDDEPCMEVVGRNGERNRDQVDFDHSRAKVAPGWADEETDYAVSYRPWAKWLGMPIDPTTLENMPPAEIAAHCLADMTFHGFEETDAQAVLEEIKAEVAKLDAMTPEEREKESISLEDVMKALE